MVATDQKKILSVKNKVINTNKKLFEKTDEKIKILFLCTGNSCRSQMAEGWAQFLKNDAIEACSAGIETHGLNANAVAVMAEKGVDISNHKSKNISGINLNALDYIITLCGHAHETCPYVPPACKVIHVAFEDPPFLAKGLTNENKILDCYRKVRDEIEIFVKTLPSSLTQIGK